MSNRKPLASETCDGVALTLRVAGPADAVALVEIERQVVEEGLANVDDRVETVQECGARIASFDPKNLWLVAEGPHGVIGSVRLIAPEPRFLAHVRNLFIDVHRDWRSHGVGRALIDGAIAWAAENDVQLIALSVLDSNPQARRLYERIGFRVTGRTPDLVRRPDGTTTGDTQMLLRIPTKDA